MSESMNLMLSANIIALLILGIIFASAFYLQRESRKLNLVAISQNSSVITTKSEDARYISTFMYFIGIVLSIIFSLMSFML